jgi:acetaldehyde dehydrogenase (acetylating)
MSIHSNNDELIRQAGIRVPVFRLVVNTPSTHGSVGLTTGIDPAMTLGCGAVGGNITSDNISPMHLINIKRVAYEIRPAQQINFSEEFHKLTTNPANSPAQPATIGTLEEKIAGFLNQRGFKNAPAPALAPVPSAPQANPAPPKLPEVEEPTVSFGQHKIYPIQSPKTSVIANPEITLNPHNNSQIIGPVDFVCEDDVRKALLARKIIAIHKKTIITPAAKDLAFNQNLFKKID